MTQAREEAELQEDSLFGSDPFHAVVLIEEPGRKLDAVDVEHSLGVPVEAVVLVDPAVARAVDAGLLLARLPTTLRRALGPLSAQGSHAAAA